VRVLLVQPPIEDFYDTAIRTYPLSLLYLAAKIREICDVSVVDFRTNKKPRPIQEHPFPELKPYYRQSASTPFSLFTSYYRFGSTKEEIQDTIREVKPDVVGISSLFTTYACEALEVARCVKRVDPEIMVVMGGLHPTAFPDHILNEPCVDYVVRGEGETPFFQLITALGAGNQSAIRQIRGVCFRKGGKSNISMPHVEEDLSLAPDRRFLAPANYRIGRNKYTFFLTSRGCPFHCSFCGRPSIPYRQRDLNGISKEIEECINLGIEALDFEDDMLALDRQFFSQVLERCEGTGLTLSAMNGIYAETLDAEMLERMFRAGFRRLNFSLVDISRAVIRNHGRLFSERFLELLPYLESSPFLTEAHFIMGLPGQTAKDVVDTMIFLMGRRVLPGPSMFYLAPGSAIFEDKVGEDWEQHIKRMRSSAIMPVNPDLTRDMLFTLMKIARFVNLVKATVDREHGMATLQDLTEGAAFGKAPHSREILWTLLAEHRFVCWDKARGTLVDEPQDYGLVKLFFERAKGAVIKGFRTGNTVLAE
jgi:anaerobic magnesium-protoporphyrin IX monomethyl ester cyclase